MTREKQAKKEKDTMEYQANPNTREIQGKLNNLPYAETDKSINLGYIP
ncbi:MAG: hypothetical protein ACOY35_03835 [Bacillota bacterium]